MARIVHRNRVLALVGGALAAVGVSASGSMMRMTGRPGPERMLAPGLWEASAWTPVHDRSSADVQTAWSALDDPKPTSLMTTAFAIEAGPRPPDPGFLVHPVGSSAVDSRAGAGLVDLALVVLGWATDSVWSARTQAIGRIASMPRWIAQVGGVAQGLLSQLDLEVAAEDVDDQVGVVGVIPALPVYVIGTVRLLEGLGVLHIEPHAALAWAEVPQQVQERDPAQFSAFLGEGDDSHGTLDFAGAWAGVAAAE